MEAIPSVGEVAAKLLPSKQRPELGEFVLGPPNRVAHAVLTTLAEGGFQPEQSPIVVVGPCGSGKTHLLQATRRAFARKFQLTEGAVYATAENFGNWFIQAVREKYQPNMPKFRRWCREAKLLVIDEIGFFSGKASTQEEFLVTVDERIRQGRPTVCACNSAIRKLGFSPPLQSRLLGGLTVEVGPLDQTIRRGLLDLLIARTGQGAGWGEEVRNYVAQKLDGDARTVIGVFNALDLHQRSLKVRIDRPLVDQILGIYGLEESLPALSLESIERGVEEYFCLLSGGSHQLRSASRAREVSYPRQLAMYLAKKLLPGLSLAEVGDHFGRRDHTTVLSAVKKVERDRQKSEPVRRDLQGVCAKLGAKWPV